MANTPNKGWSHQEPSPRSYWPWFSDCWILVLNVGSGMIDNNQKHPIPSPLSTSEILILLTILNGNGMHIQSKFESCSLHPHKSWVPPYYTCPYIVSLRPGRVCCPGKCFLTAQGQCFIRFGMSSISPDGWRDLFPQHETLNPKP